MYSDVVRNCIEDTPVYKLFYMHNRGIYIAVNWIIQVKPRLWNILLGNVGQ